jgi:hypothetical protein
MSSSGYNSRFKPVDKIHMADSTMLALPDGSHVSQRLWVAAQKKSIGTMDG